MEQPPTSPTSPEEILTAQASSGNLLPPPPAPPSSSSSFVMNFNKQNKRKFLPAVLALAFLLLSLPLALVVVKQNQAPKKASCGEPNQPPCKVPCGGMCGGAGFECEEPYTCQPWAGNYHCYNPNCSIPAQLGLDCCCPLTPTPRPTPTGVPCGSQTCAPNETCCNPKVCNNNKQCVAGTEFHCWAGSQCPNPGCRDNYDCEEHETTPPPPPPPTATPTPPPPPPSCDCFCDKVVADKNVNNLKVGDVVVFTGSGKVGYPTAITKIKFIISRNGTTVVTQEVPAVLDRHEGGFYFYKANFSYTIESAGNYTVAIQVWCPTGWRD